MLQQFTYTVPQSPQQFEWYYQLRWQVLRKPWGQTIGTEKDDIEALSYHRMLIDDKNKPVAVVRMHRVDKTRAVVRFMAVLPEIQGQGAGKYLMQCLQQEAKQLGITIIELAARDNAIKFYQSLGYQLGEFSHNLYQQIPHYKMHKALIPHDQTDLLTELTQLWWQTIPVARFSGIEAIAINKGGLFVSADAANNKNLHNTMFAGSINTLATLTGWGWGYLLAKAIKPTTNIVLADASIRYLKPVEGMAIASTNNDLVEGNLVTLAKGKRSRLSIHVNIHCGDVLAAKFHGKYIVSAKEEQLSEK